MTTNALLLRYDGGYSEDIDAVSIAAGVRHEALLAVSDVRSIEEALRIADVTLESYARTLTAVEAALIPIDSQETPYVGFDVGDTVTVDDENDAPASTRVRAISVSENTEGQVFWEPELGDLIEDPDQRNTRWLRRMVNGTLAGRSESAQPLTSPVKSLSQAPTRSTSRPYATFVVAASNSYAPGYDTADYICDDVNAAVGINAAVAAINPEIGGRIVLLEGTYPLLSGIVLSADATDGDITFEGQGFATHLVAADDSFIMVTGDWSHIQIANLQIDGDGFDVVGVDFDLGQPGTHHRLRSCWIHDCTYGLLPADLTSLRIMDCDFYGNDFGIYTDRPQDLQILDSRFEGNGEHVHLHDASDAGDENSAQIENCVLRDATTIGINTRSRWAIIKGCLMQDNPVHVAGFHGGTQTVQVLGNRVLGGTTGVDIDESGYNQINGNYFVQVTTGVSIHDASDSNAVRSNFFENCTTGVSINNNQCDDNVVSNNDFRNCGTDISDSGTATITTDNTTA